MKLHTTTLLFVALLGMGMLPVDQRLMANGTESENVPQLTIDLKEMGTDKPVGGATLTIEGNETRFDRQTTGIDGRCTITLPKRELQSLYVETALAGWVPMELYWYKKNTGDHTPERITIQMERATSIGGRVVDDGGQPVVGATVVLHVHKQYPGSKQRVKVCYKYVTTDKNGKWSCSLVPVEFDSIDIGVFHHRYVSGPSGVAFYPMEDFKPISALHDGTAISKIQRGVLIEGVVRGSDGKPIAKAKVGYGRDRCGSNILPEQETDADGRFACGANVGDTATITVKAAGYAPEMKQFVVTKSASPLVFDLQSGHLLTGQVVDDQGKPIAGARIYMDTWRGARTLDENLNSDSDGHFTWKEAPADLVYADILKIGYADNRQLAIIAGGENEIVLHNPTVVKGTVVDAQTGQSVPDFRVITGSDWGNGCPISWDRQNESIQGKEGKFVTSFTYPCPKYLIQIEADGYLPADSEPFSLDGTEKKLSFKLVKGEEIKGSVCSTDGKPVAGADLVMITPSNNWQIINGRIPKYALRNVVHVVSGENGSFRFLPQKDTFLLLAVHDSGYAKVTDAELKTNNVITLQAWATVQGIVKTGVKAAAKQSLALAYLDNSKFDPNKPRVNAYCEVTADENGKFKIERVMAGNVSVSKTVKISDRMFGHSSATNVIVEPGQTVEVTVGGTGRSVVGHIDLPDDLKKGSWMVVNAILMATVPEPEVPEDVRKMTTAERAAWYEKWKQTPQGKTFLDTQRKAVERYFAVCVERDGSFRVDDVPEGAYTLNIALAGLPSARQCGPGEEIGIVIYKFTMPPIPGGVSGEPLNLPILSVSRINHIQVGDLAPPFAFKTLDGREMKLADDFKGKYVLLDFWATWCGPCRGETPYLKAAYDEFGKNEHFAMIGLSMDESVDAPKKYAQDNGIKWIQGFLGRETAGQTVPNLYGVRGIPSIWLIGPDGKVLAKDLRGEQIKTATAAAILTTP